MKEPEMKEPEMKELEMKEPEMKEPETKDPETKERNQQHLRLHLQTQVKEMKEIRMMAEHQLHNM